MDAYPSRRSPMEDLFEGLSDRGQRGATTLFFRLIFFPFSFFSFFFSPRPSSQGAPRGGIRGVLPWASELPPYFFFFFFFLPLGRDHGAPYAPGPVRFFFTFLLLSSTFRVAVRDFADQEDLGPNWRATVSLLLHPFFLFFFSPLPVSSPRT